MPSDDMLQATMKATSEEAVEKAPRSPADDQRIAAGCAAGDTRVFEELYVTHGNRMKSIAYNHLGNTSDAEDAVQETFLKLHRAARTYTGEASFSTWLCRILINTCIDMIRKRRRRTDDAAIEDELLLRSGATVDDTKRMTLRKLLLSLPEQRRTVFTLFEIEGMSHAEIGRILGITEGNSKWILFSTKKQLQELWKQR
jgi:RNA polymerase sigma factor (sigma-70 family)